MSNAEGILSSSTDESTKPATEKPAAKLPETAADDPDRFRHGVLIRGKFIGVEDVKKENGDDICQSSMIKLKALVLAKKEHKRRICVKINLDGIEIVDELTNESLYKHSVNRISYIARDINDSRAIGYIYKNENNEFQYFAIKTRGQAQELFLNLKDLFQTVLEIKNKKKAEKKAESESAKNSDKPSSNLQSQLSADVEVIQENLKQMEKEEDLLNMIDTPAPSAQSASAQQPTSSSIFDDFDQLNISSSSPPPSSSTASSPSTVVTQTAPSANDLSDLFSSISTPSANTMENFPQSSPSSSSFLLSTPGSSLGGGMQQTSQSRAPPLPPFPSQQTSMMNMNANPFSQQQQQNPMMGRNSPFGKQQQQNPMMGMNSPFGQQQQQNPMMGMNSPFGQQQQQNPMMGMNSPFGQQQQQNPMMGMNSPFGQQQQQPMGMMNANQPNYNINPFGNAMSFQQQQRPAPAAPQQQPPKSAASLLDIPDPFK